MERPRGPLGDVLDDEECEERLMMVEMLLEDTREALQRLEEEERRLVDWLRQRNVSTDTTSSQS